MTKPAKTSLSMRFDNLRPVPDTVSDKGGEQRNELFVQPPQIVETVVSSGLSQASSIGIGEFGMNVAQERKCSCLLHRCKGEAVPAG